LKYALDEQPPDVTGVRQNNLADRGWYARGQERHRAAVPHDFVCGRHRVAHGGWPLV
jgi:hypothetical protein